MKYLNLIKNKKHIIIKIFNEIIFFFKIIFFYLYKKTINIKY